MEGDIFGGFTPVEWESRVWNGKHGNESNCCKADDTLKRFLVTLKNPHNIPARRFALPAEAKQYAIICGSEWGLAFGDIAVSNDCNTNTSSSTWLDNSYTNDTRLAGTIVLTGSKNFQVKEIEVFEIAA
jgi:phosphopantetheinyl transferase (holo-ACP synthase)